MRSAYQAVEIVGRSGRRRAARRGRHAPRRSARATCSSSATRRPRAFASEPGRAARRLAVRVNPRLDVDAEVTGALLSVRGVDGAVRAVVQAGSAGIEGASGALDLRVTSGSAAVGGVARAGTGGCAARARRSSVVLDARRGRDGGGDRPALARRRPRLRDARRARIGRPRDRRRRRVLGRASSGRHEPRAPSPPARRLPGVPLRAARHAAVVHGVRHRGHRRVHDVRVLLAGRRAIAPCSSSSCSRAAT